jgi:hypothetical protein
MRSTTYSLRNETSSLRSAVGDGRCPKYEVTAGWDSMDIPIKRASLDCFSKCGERGRERGGETEGMDSLTFMYYSAQVKITWNSTSA